MLSGHLYERRPLKKPRIGPPDVYPQDPKQKEDELNVTNVKHGFLQSTHLNDEFGSAREKSHNITANRVGAYFNGIIASKEKLNTLLDSGRKKQQINHKDNFWQATQRTKDTIKAWFKDLAGTKPLVILSKKAPNFNKKEDIFTTLCEYQVPMMRATWYIKLSSAYTVAVTEAKLKKRQLPDPTTEWTSTLLKFLKDQVPKLQEYYSQTEKSQNAPLTNQTNEADLKMALRYWQYCTQLLKYMYDEGLLDRQDVLNWILELLEKLRFQLCDDGILKLYMPLTHQYMEEFVQSELLSRRLAHYCCRKINFMLGNVTEATNLLASPQGDNNNTNNSSSSSINNTTNNRQQEMKDGMDKEKKENPTNPIQNTIMEYQNCQHHRDVLLQLSAVIHCISLECPTALIWCGTGSGTLWHGSPLDLMQVSPSTLPMVNRSDAAIYKKQVVQMEHNIRERSKKAEGRWCTDKWQTSSAACLMLMFGIFLVCR